MPTRYLVQEGDCLSSIAFTHGFFPATLWKDPANARLRADRRDNPNALAPGDVVTIPDKQAYTSNVATGARHRFRVRGVPARFRVQILDDGEPVGGAPFTIDVDGAVTSGTTTGDGIVEVSIQPDARRAHLTVGGDGDEDGPREYDFALGRLDPVGTPRGAQQRLANLGLLGPEALRAFQGRHGLPVSGELDAATQARLVELHDHL